MSDHSLAALQRIRDLAETCAYEAEGIDEECKTGASSALAHAARLLLMVASDFGGAA